MSLVVTLTLPGGSAVDITSYLTNGQFSVSRSEGGDGASCSFSLTNYPNEVTQGDILATWNGTPIYRGRVVQRSRKEAYNVVFTYPRTVDAVVRLKETIIAASYEEASASYIVDSLLNRYMPDITPKIETVTLPLTQSFNYVTLKEGVTRTAEAVGASWAFMPDNSFRFYTDYYDDGAVPSFDSSVILADTFEESESAKDFYNSIVVIGAKGVAPGTLKQTFTGESDVFALAHEPNYVVVKVNGITKDAVSKDNVGAGAADFTYDKKGRRVTSQMVLAPADVVEITYRPTIEIVSKRDDKKSIATYGRRERVIKSRGITDDTTARQLARAMLKRTSVVRPVYSWETDSDVAVNVFPGRRCQIVYPSLGINAYGRVLSTNTTFTFYGHRWDVRTAMEVEGLS